MERKLLERMLGAGALIAALVIVGPLLLDGKSDLPARLEEAGSSATTEDFQTHTVTLRPRGSAGQPAGVESMPARPASPTVPAAVPQAAATTGSSIAPVAPDRPPQAIARADDQPTAPLHTTPPPAVPPAVTTVAAPPPAVPAPAAVGGWAVQLGTFGERANAERLTRELAGRGFAAFVSPFNQAGKNLYRVRVGPVRERGAADELARKLTEAGHTGPVVAN